MVIVLSDILLFLENLISGSLPFALTALGGIYLTVKGKFFQISGLFKSFSLVTKGFKTKKTKEDGITSFQAACTALSATVGTGNIAGVAGAISLGGAGAVFWMWIAAFFGMAVKYGEVALSIIHRDNELLKGGPMYYIKKGCPVILKKMAVVFAFCALPAVICGGNITQTNAAITSYPKSFIVRLLSGIVFAVLTAIAIKGGIKQIGNITEKLVPIMSLVYIILTVTIILINTDALVPAIKMIFKGAFTPRAVTGGAIGSMSRAALIGASRGVFSNEAGLGTSGMSHSVASDANPKTQGLFGIFEVFVDTVLICTLTALTILCSGVNINYGTDASSYLVIDAVSTVFGRLSGIIISVMMIVFAFSSVIGWAVYGQICTEWIGNKSLKKLFLKSYPLFCIVGAVCNTAYVWRLAAFFNGIMLCINLPAVIYMSNDFLINEGKKSDFKKNRKFKKKVRFK